MYNGRRWLAAVFKTRLPPNMPGWSPASRVFHCIKALPRKNPTITGVRRRVGLASLTPRHWAENKIVFVANAPADVLAVLSPDGLLLNNNGRNRFSFVSISGVWFVLV